MKRKRKFAILALVVVSALLAACAKPAQKVVVATDATFPPFEMVDEETKELIGFDVELMNAIAEKAGIEIEWVNLPFDSMLAGISECQYDMSIAAISATEERMKTMLFSDPYVDAGQIVVVRADETEIQSKDDLSGKTVAAQLGTTGEIEAQAIDGIIYKPYDSYDLAMLDLINGQVDAVIADQPTADEFVSRNADKLMTVGDTFTEEKYAIAFCMEKTDLRDTINTALNALIDEGVVAQLAQKWLAGGGS